MLEMTVEQNYLKETLNKLITPIVRQAHYERNQYLAVRPELVKGPDRSFLNYQVYILEVSS